MAVMKKFLLTSIAVLFLATGAAHADDFVVLIQKDNENTSTAFVRMNMSCEEMLESHERNRKAGTWLTYTPAGGGEPWRITWVGCLSAVSEVQCPAGKTAKRKEGPGPTIAGKTAERGKECG